MHERVLATIHSRLNSNCHDTLRVMTNVREWIGKHKVLGVIFALLVIGLIEKRPLSGSAPAPAAAPAQAQETANTPAMSSAEAASEFKDFMDLSKTATLGCM